MNGNPINYIITMLHFGWKVTGQERANYGYYDILSTWGQQVLIIYIDRITRILSWTR